MNPTTRADGLDSLVGTFTRDREFCEALALSHPREVARLLVFIQWVHAYISPIQSELSEMASGHFPVEHADVASLWTLAAGAGIAKDLLLIVYLVVRGAVSEAGFAFRRSLENVGVLTHLWNWPANSACLGPTDGTKFRSAFIWEPDKARRAALRARGIQKRFERSAMPRPPSGLYDLLGTFTVHGGSPNKFVGADLIPTAFSCGLLNRPDPGQTDLGRHLALLGGGMRDALR